MNYDLQQLITKMVADAIAEATQSAREASPWQDDDLLTDAQAAKVLNIAPKTLPVWRHHGRGPPRRKRLEGRRPGRRPLKRKRRRRSSGATRVPGDTQGNPGTETRGRRTRFRSSESRSHEDSPRASSSGFSTL